MSAPAADRHLTAPPASTRSSRLVRAFRVVAAVEAVTWVGLLVGMHLEHVAGVTDLGVWLFGRLHGGAFLVYSGLAVLCWRRLRWGLPTAALALLAGVPPLGTVAFERWATRTGRLPR